MARATSGLAYPERFRAAAAYAGFGTGSPDLSSAPISKFPSESALLLCGLYQQATVGPCMVPKPKSWNPVEQGKWNSWKGLGETSSTEAMRLFVKILEEEEPAWYSKIPELNVELYNNVDNNKLKQGAGNVSEEARSIHMEKAALVETQDRDIRQKGFSWISTCDQWKKLSTSGQQPRPRYEHGAVVLHEKMYTFGGNYNGRYLNDTQVLDLKSLTWSKLNATTHDPKRTVAPCAGHSLVCWENTIFSIGGRTKVSSESIAVKKFDMLTCTWLAVETNGKAPVSREGQSVSNIGASLVIFGGEDATRSLLNDVHVLNLQTMTWKELDAVGPPPSGRSYHTAAVHADRYLLIFGGRSHTACLNDLHILDLQNMEWSTPVQQGIVPAPRAGHAGVTISENWFIVGGGDNKNGLAETLMLNMSTLVWSVVTTAERNASIASEGLSMVMSSYMGEDILIAFGGYNGRYSNEVYVLKPSYGSDMQSKLDNASVTIDLQTKDVETDTNTAQNGKIREITEDDSVVEHAKNIRRNDSNIKIIESLRAEKEALERTISGEQMQTFQLKQELVDAETRNSDLIKELQSVRGQLATEQSRCFKLEVDMAEIRQKLLSMEALQKEVELLRRQKAATEEATLEAQQRPRSGGVWGWIAGTPPEYRPADT